MKTILLVLLCANLYSQLYSSKVNNETSDKFEMTRFYIQTWLSEASNDCPIISSSCLKEKILDDWSNKHKQYQIVSVRKPIDYKTAGHIPHAINIYWIDIVTDESFSLLDSQKTIVLYCYYGHGSMISCTILSLLGYRCYSLDFGMMDWNLDALVKEPYDQMADYDVEKTVNLSIESYTTPVIMSDQTDSKNIIKEMARKYLAGDGSPIIRSSDVKAIVDNCDFKKAEYQIVDVRLERDYESGHVPNAINIPWLRIAENENLRKLDPHKTVIVCSDNGQLGQLASTILNMLGYNSVNMLFGMLDWNKAYVDNHNQCDGVNRYPVEYGN